VAELIGRHKVPKGPRLAIVTNAGGPGVMASDALIEAGGQLAKLSPATIEFLNQSLPPAWSHGNPVDVLGDAKSKTVAKAINAVLQDEGVDAVLLIVTPQAMTNPPGIAKELMPIAAEAKKPILAAFLGGPLGITDNRLARRLQVVGEQACFCFKILIHVGMIIEMITRQIGEGGDIELDVADPRLGQGMRGDLHDDVADAASAIRRSSSCRCKASGVVWEAGRTAFPPAAV